MAPGIPLSRDQFDLKGTPSQPGAEAQLGELCVLRIKIGRSPLAQGVFEDVLRREGLEDEVFVDSAGTRAYYPGSPPDERAQRSAGLRGLDLSAQRVPEIVG
jgi:protein-tyrosine-phosphatase